jgi:tetratricopeptide (TPR) repeat protein
VALDDSLAEAYTSLAYARFMFGWDWPGAEQGFKAAIKRNPKYSIVRHWFGEFLMAMGRFDEATEQLELAQQLDPLSMTIGFGVGWVRYFTGDYAAAIDQYERTLQSEPSFVLAPWFLGPAYVQAGEYDRAIAVYEEWIPRAHRHAGLEALLAHAYGLAGYTDKATAAAADLEERAEREAISPDYMALVHIGLGDHDRAFEWLDEALQQHVWYLVFLAIEPAFAPLRSDPRYAALLKEVGLKRN